VKLPYDIFRKLPGGGPIWIEAVQGLELARIRLTSLMKTHPSEYFIYDHSSGKTISIRTFKTA
jgi:hypothetical protein